MALSVSLPISKHVPPSLHIPRNNRQLLRHLPPKDKVVVVVLGATASGKSRLSIDLATNFAAEVINSDKIKVYRGLDITNNKITDEERGGVPHHLLGVVDPDSDFSADKTPTEGKYPESLSATDKDSKQGKTSGDSNTCGGGPASFAVRDLTASLPENNSPLLILNDKSGSDKTESTSNIANTDDEGSMSQSSKIDMIDALAKIIADARDNKKMLFSAMDSVISLMREVQHKEQAAEQAKVEAAMGRTDILVKSEELKKMVKKAEEANSTHAGEVYGEKAILASEIRELQSRALSLSVERDKYLAVLDEMQQTLEVRLTEAENVIKSPEQEKMEKEKAAKEALAEQESIMEKVLQESKILNQQAEDNAKLREFLVDRGHVVDMLQGQISVICQDVRLLKEKFDEHIPLSKSLSSSQTSFILASSGSSSKSLIPEQVEALPDEGAADGSLDTREKEGAISCSTGDSSSVQVARNNHKSLSDDEWEIFDYDVALEFCGF